ncbi:unnamed protein product [Porites lobata]|uniref:Uncharacterized protein n=1 Tax=Porites lobata TaxID=104759 RepID=A0ABN8PBT0_9CNID|nr:unnamed protein product [Porites lobata]
MYLFHKHRTMPYPEMRFSCIPRGPLLQSQRSGIELSRCYRYRENKTLPSSENFVSVSESIKFSTSEEDYFAGVRLFAQKEDRKDFSVQVRISRNHKMKEEVCSVRGTLVVI